MSVCLTDLADRLADAHSDCCGKAAYCLGSGAYNSERFWSGRAAGLRHALAMLAALLIEEEFVQAEGAEACVEIGSN